MTHMPIRVALVEDDATQRAELIELLKDSPDIALVGAWCSLPEAVECLPGVNPSVVLVDIGLGCDSGIELVRELKPRMAETQFMMLTVVRDTTRVFAALKAGATGYLLKKDAPSRLAERIAELVAGGAPMSSAIAREVVGAFREPVAGAEWSIQSPTSNGLNPGSADACPQAQSAVLTTRECDVLDQLSRGLLYKEIAQILQISVGTVRTHIHRIYEKLHVRNRTEALLQAPDKTRR